MYAIEALFLQETDFYTITRNHVILGAYIAPLVLELAHGDLSVSMPFYFTAKGQAVLLLLRRLLVIRFRHLTAIHVQSRLIG